VNIQDSNEADGGIGRYGCEIWVLTKKNEIKLEAWERKMPMNATRRERRKKEEGKSEEEMAGGSDSRRENARCNKSEESVTEHSSMEKNRKNSHRP
jgi:hypothetical protein